MPIDWSLAKAPDIVGNALQYRQAGMAEDVAANERNLLQQSRLRQEGREVAQDARLIRQDARQVTQDEQANQDRQIAAAIRNADTLANFAYGLKGKSPEIAKQLIAQHRADLIAMGLPPEKIDTFDPSPENIDLVIKGAMDAKERAAAEKGPTAPSGYTWGADGKSLAAIPGGPGDPKVIGANATTRREVVVNNPLPNRARAGGGNTSGVPAGFVLD